jgi:hypothetical protein
MMQTTLLGQRDIHRASGPFNDIKNGIQRIRITEGCPNQCPFCYEPDEPVSYPIPVMQRRYVQVLDMNLTARADAPELVLRLGQQRMNGKPIFYELVCGIDYRYIDQDLANLLHENHFIKPRIAWDWSYSEQGRIKRAIWMLKAAGYKAESIMVFMLCNWRISHAENCRKLDLLKVWNVKACDCYCYYDGQVSPNIIPLFWTARQIRDFRARARKHNQLVLFKGDPQPSIKLEASMG